MKLKRLILLILSKNPVQGFSQKKSFESILKLYAAVTSNQRSSMHWFFTNLKNIMEQNQNLALGLKPSK